MTPDEAARIKRWALADDEDHGRLRPPMTQQPALVRGQQWAPGDGTSRSRMVLTVDNDGIEYVTAYDTVDGAAHIQRMKCSWTAWRDWQQRHDARVMEGDDHGT